MNDEDNEWINIDPKSERLSLRFWVKGFPKQFYLSTGLKKNKTNLNAVRNRRDLIRADIALGRFDHTLQSYKFGSINTSQELLADISLSDLWKDFCVFQSQRLEASTLATDYKQVTGIINKLPTQSLDDAVAIRDLLLQRYKYFTAFKVIKALERCCNWAVNSNLISNNPFTKIILPKPKNLHANDFKAYTLEQRDLIISAFEVHETHSHYTNLVKFLFYTGCRPGEAFALTWGDISSDCCRILISKSYVSLVKVLKGTKNNKSREFVSSEESKLRSLLLAMRPQFPKPGDLVFTTKTGLRVNLPAITKAWKGHQTSNYHYKGVVTELADQGLVPYLKLYSTRHTFASWAIASGASPDAVAYWIGDNIQTVLKYYCHPEVTKKACPDF